MAVVADTSIAPQVVTGLFSIGSAAVAFAGGLFMRGRDAKTGEAAKWRAERLTAASG